MNDENFDLSHWTRDSVAGLEKELITRKGRFLLQLQDPVLYREFREFMSLSKAWRFAILLNIAITFFFIPPIVSQAVFRPVSTFTCLEFLLIILTINSAWLSFFIMREDSPVRRYCSFLLSWTRNTSWQSLSDQLQAVLYLSLVILMSLVMIRRVMKGECKEVRFWNVWMCNSSASSNVYPVDSAVLLMMIPIFFCCVMREMRIVLTIVAWSIVMFTLIYCTCLLPSFMSIYALIIYGLASYAIMLDSFKQYLLLYLLSRQLKKTIEVNQELTNQNKATEMRHMIANVAHDLKTPLSSFMTGIDLISADVAELVDKLQSRMTPRVDIGSDFLASFAMNLQSSILNIRNTNAFMLMTINRCLDYTKSSNGMKLAPKYETIELAETLTLPMFCMTNMQQKNKISLVPYDDEGICSHIITDKQWLQENVLCLLSNAVKYSAGGEVQIRVTKVKKSEKEGDDASLAEKIAPITLGLHERYRPLKFTNKESWLSLTNFFLSATVDNRFMSGKNLRLQSRYNYDHHKIVPTNDIEENMELVNVSVSESSKDLQTSGKASESTPGTTRMSFRHSFLQGKTVASSTSETEELLFEVIDGGIGVPVDAMNTLFNPFKQTQRLAGGTGLGLYSLAKRIEALKGKFGVHKRVDGKQGSVFWFTIPYKADMLTAAHFVAKEEISLLRRSVANESFPIHAARIARNEAQLSVKANDHVTDLRILLAEDTPSIAKMMKLLLNRQRHDVTVAENGQIALDMLSEGKYDVVLMDLQMPVMDGLEATRRIRTGERNNGGSEHQIVIGVSANSDNETMEEGLRAGIDDFLPKPFSMEAFIGAIKRAEEKYGKYGEAI